MILSKGEQMDDAEIIDINSCPRCGDSGSVIFNDSLERWECTNCGWNSEWIPFNSELRKEEH